MSKCLGGYSADEPFTFEYYLHAGPEKCTEKECGVI